MKKILIITLLFLLTGCSNTEEELASSCYISLSRDAECKNLCKENFGYEDKFLNIVTKEECMYLMIDYEKDREYDCNCYVYEREVLQEQEENDSIVVPEIIKHGEFIEVKRFNIK